MPAPRGWARTSSRRTLGSELNDAGLSARVIATQLRHTDSRTTERHYTARRGGNAQVREAIEAMLSTAPERPAAPPAKAGLVT